MKRATSLAVVLALAGTASGQTVNVFIDWYGDGAGNNLSSPANIAVGASGNTYVAASVSHNAFKVTPTGIITEIIDSTGDGAGNALSRCFGIAVDASDNVYVTGWNSDNAFKITPAGVITEIVDQTGDGEGNPLDAPYGIAVDVLGHVYVTGYGSHVVFKITLDDAIPTVSQWGLAIMALLVLTAGMLVCVRRRAAMV